MEYTNYFASMNKMIGAFPALRYEQYKKMMNIVALESKLQLIRELKPNDTISQQYSSCIEYESKLGFKLRSLTGGKRPEVLFVELITG